ncbi:hypothetical protein M3484_05970 [Pseudomonas sp. GX19020]|uniref:hypothetical protein n=1 Tax=Pseudomonas sp. GX19020 TaxID=2942277 RepID=UPI00201857BD|nr:hypothetical protein [Pseudomonas sp. GX19020]MCL4066110.1 hypothetical protein [Pseudomonas sp. GX19020]
MRSLINEGAALPGGIDVLWDHAGIPGPGGVEALDVDACNLAMTLPAFLSHLAGARAVSVRFG